MLEPSSCRTKMVGWELSPPPFSLRRFSAASLAVHSAARRCSSAALPWTPARQGLELPLEDTPGTLNGTLFMKGILSYLDLAISGICSRACWKFLRKFASPRKKLILVLLLVVWPSFWNISLPKNTLLGGWWFLLFPKVRYGLVPWRVALIIVCDYQPCTTWFSTIIHELLLEVVSRESSTIPSKEWSWSVR